MKTKMCAKCKVEKPMSEFYNSRSKKYSECKTCTREERKKYYKDAKESILLSRKVYYQNNKDRIAKYYQDSKERLKIYNKKNEEKIAVRKRKWSQNNAHKRKESFHKYYANKSDNGGSFTAKEWQDLCGKYDNKCLCCNKKKKLTVDHVIPVSKGGTSNIDNIQPLCGPCNSSKGTKDTDYR